MATDSAKIAQHLDDRNWRLSHLYKIITKGDDGDDGDGLVIDFQPNRAQRKLLARLWHRNIILKARQLGFTTLVCLLWLDTALFSKSPIRCGIIAQDREAAESLFRTKVRFAYDNLPEPIRAMFPLKKATGSELEFAHNGASIRVATSMRSGTIHRLHISEFGKICAKFPDKAREVVTGSIPAVPKSGMLIIESTAEGQDGPFYTMTERAMAVAAMRRVLTQKDYAFHFFPWWDAAEYRLEAVESVVLTEADHAYFSIIEQQTGRPIDMQQRAWYVATRLADFGGDAPLMWQEYPSTPKEAFQVSTEGCYYAAQLALAREQGRVVQHIPIEAAPVNTFWDIGRGDMTTIWLHQRIGMQNRFLRYYEASGEDLAHFVAWLQKQGLTYGRHYLPHDAAHRRMGMDADTSRTMEEMLRTLMPGQTFTIVPRVSNITAGIQATRNVFAACWFDETGCQKGLQRLASYRKEWDKVRGCWSQNPLHDDASHGADAFRQFGQEADGGNLFPGGGRTAPAAGSSGGFRRRPSGMAV